MLESRLSSSLSGIFYFRKPNDARAIKRRKKSFQSLQITSHDNKLEGYGQLCKIKAKSLLLTLKRLLKVLFIFRKLV